MVICNDCEVIIMAKAEKITDLSSSAIPPIRWYTKKPPVSKFGMIPASAIFQPGYGSSLNPNLSGCYKTHARASGLQIHSLLTGAGIRKRALRVRPFSPQNGMVFSHAGFGLALILPCRCSLNGRPFPHPKQDINLAPLRPHDN